MCGQPGAPGIATGFLQNPCNTVLDLRAQGEPFCARQTKGSDIRVHLRALGTESNLYKSCWWERVNL